MGTRTRASGFTLVEAMVVTGILAVLAGMGMPMLADTIHAHRVQGSAQSLAADLRAAQAEAIRRNRSVELIFTNAPPTPASVVVAQPVSASAARAWTARVVNPTATTDFVVGNAMDGDFASVVLVNDVVNSVGAGWGA